ncbi:MAG: response regulator transcription factor [Chloroflexota bacterium]
MTHLLLIDDEPTITEPLARRLQARSYQVTVAADGKEGLAVALASQPDLVILDVMMPEMDGWEVCRTLREQSSVPILMLTALDDDFDRITGLELGADDYLTKPFNTNVLVAKINALLRRVQLDQPATSPARTLVVGPIKLELDLRAAYVHEQPVKLRHKEFELLTLLMSKVGIPVTRAQIFDEVWGTDWLGDTSTLDVHIRWLREKLEADPSRPKYICTVRNVGYVFNNAE